MSAIGEAARGADTKPALAAFQTLLAASASGDAELLKEAAGAVRTESRVAAQFRAGGEALVDAEGLARFALAVLDAVPRATESAAFSIIERFEAVHETAAKAAKVARSARDFFGAQDGEATTLRRAEGTRKAIQAERLAVAGIAERNRKGAKSLRGIRDEISAGIDLIRGIEEITERSRLIAFNLAVEAAHFGDKGRGFKIIASELRALNDRTEEFSRRVTELLTRLGEESALLVSGMAEESDRLVAEAEKGMNAAEASVEALIETAEATERFAREISELAEETDRDMEGVLESLQFQDITRQIIEGAEAMITEIAALLPAVESALPQARRLEGESARRARFEALRSRLLAASKTRDEKEAIQKVEALRRANTEVKRA